MRIADKGVDHKSLWIDQRSQKTQPGRMSGEGKLNKTTEKSEEGGARRGEGEAGGRAWVGGGSKARGRKEFVTNEERKARRKREEGDQQGYYKGAMCHLVCENCHTHSADVCVCVCHCVMKSEEMGDILLFYNSVHTHKTHAARTFE